MKRLILAIALLVSATTQAATTTYNQFQTSVTPVATSTAYCTSANPAVIVGTFLPASSSTVDTSVANLTKIIAHDSLGGTYWTSITVAASGVGSVTTIPACAVKQ